MTAVALKNPGIGDTERQEFLPEPSWFARPIPPFGAESLALQVGGMTVALDGFSPEQTATLRTRYGIFVRSDASDLKPALRISVRRAPVPGFLKVNSAPGHVEYYRVESRWERGILTATSYEWAGWFDFASGMARLALAETTVNDARAFDRSLENFLRVAYAHLVIGRGGFLLHSAGLVLDGEAHLFFGPSGSGKTTVTTLTPEATILSDDLTLVLKAEDGPGAGYVACSVPFRGLFAPQPASDARWPIRGFYRLVQALEDRLEPLSGARAVGELMGSLPFVTDRPEMAGPVMDVVAAAAEKVAVSRLHFRKDRTFWQVVRPEMSAVDSFRQNRGIRS